MEQDGAVEVATGTSEEAPVTETTTDTSTPQAEQTPDLDRLVADVEKNWDRIPAETRERLNRHFQPAFSRRVNLLNQSVETAVKNAGITIPEGKTPLDLLTENEGKDFGSYIRSELAKEVAPIKEQISKAEQQQTLQASIRRAVQMDPDIQPYVERAVQAIDGDADLSQMAMLGNGNGLFYVLRAVAGFEAKDQKIRELTGLLEKNKIAIKTAGGTTRAGAGAPKTTPPSAPKTLKDAARQAMAQIKADMEAGS